MMIAAFDKDEKNRTELRLLLIVDREMKNMQKWSEMVLSTILGQSSFRKMKRDDPRDGFIYREDTNAQHKVDNTST